MTTSSNATEPSRLLHFLHKQIEQLREVLGLPRIAQIPADEDNDEHELEDQSTTSTPHTTATHSSTIADLEASLASKQSRIDELEAALAKAVYQNVHLKRAVDARDARLANME